MAKKLWGGRFKKKIDKDFERFSQSIHVDHELAYYDVWGSIFHLEVLYKSGLNIISKPEYTDLKKQLHGILADISSNKFKYNKKSEDIHTEIQNQLERKVGKAALKLHTFRSRNEQVVFDTKMYCKLESNKIKNCLGEVRFAISQLIKRHANLKMPGYTHMQHAELILFSDYLKAYLNMFERDVRRIMSVTNNIKLILGSGAIAGSPIAKDYSKLSELAKKLANEMGIVVNINSPSNTIDDVSDRDFVIEILSAISILQMHLSRMAEDFIIWSTSEFGFIEIGDEFCTGSSLMSHKKNPDSLELIRGNTGRIYGNLLSVLTMMKGLPLAYNRDMQNDKEPLFNSVKIVKKELVILAKLLSTLDIKEDNINKQCDDESLHATKLVKYLVAKGIPFREAHTIIGKLIRYSIDNKIKIKNMGEDLIKKKFSNKFVKKEVVKLFDPLVSVKSKKSIKR